MAQMTSNGGRNEMNQPRQTHSEHKTNKKDIPCKWFCSTGCRFGQHCWYRHGIVANSIYDEILHTMDDKLKKMQQNIIGSVQKEIQWLERKQSSEEVGTAHSVQHNIHQNVLKLQVTMSTISKSLNKIEKEHTKQMDERTKAQRQIMSKIGDINSYNKSLKSSLSKTKKETAHNTDKMSVINSNLIEIKEAMNGMEHMVKESSKKQKQFNKGLEAIKEQRQQICDALLNINKSLDTEIENKNGDCNDAQNTIIIEETPALPSNTQTMDLTEINGIDGNIGTSTFNDDIHKPLNNENEVIMDALNDELKDEQQSPQLTAIGANGGIIDELKEKDRKTNGVNKASNDVGIINGIGDAFELRDIDNINDVLSLKIMEKDKDNNGIDIGNDKNVMLCLKTMEKDKDTVIDIDNNGDKDCINIGGFKYEHYFQSKRATQKPRPTILYASGNNQLKIKTTFSFRRLHAFTWYGLSDYPTYHHGLNEYRNKLNINTNIKKLARSPFTTLIITANSTEIQQKSALQHKEIGNKLYKIRKFNEALMEYEEAIALDPINPIYSLNKAAALYMLEQWRETVICCENVLNITMDKLWRFKALKRIGSVYENQENLSAAVLSYTAAINEKEDGILSEKLNEIGYIVNESGYVVKKEN